MFKPFWMQKHKIGMPAGELVHVGDHSTEPMKLSVITYNENEIIEENNTSFDISLQDMPKDHVKWIEIDGVHQSELIQMLGSKLQLHPLVMEDIMTTRQRPKVDEYSEYLFIVLRLLIYDEVSGNIQDEQLSLILGRDYLITFQEKSSSLFDHLKERLRLGKGLIRKQRADFLAYAIIDTIVDHYFVLIESVGGRIEHLEDALSNMATQKGLSAIHQLRREIVFLRKSLLPMREVINRLQRDDSELISSTTKFYLKDVYDHTIQVIDTVDAFRDLGRGLLDVNLSHMSYRMNEIIKILTVVSTLFVPLTFITSIYGMNFVHMPELRWRYGYVAVWVIMILVAAYMIRYFKRKKWI